MSINFDCGYFSYAEIPNQFQLILGVTGTLSQLKENERNMIKEDYKLECFTFMPSVFGRNNLDFKKNAHVHIADKTEYFMKLADEIKQKLGDGDKKRAVIVFFETKEKLLEFKKSDKISSLYSNIKELTEELSIKEKEKRIR